MSIIYTVLFLILTTTTALAAKPDQLSFADSLAAEGDHYRAITEYKRFLHYQLDDTRRAYAQLQIARSLITGKRWQQADAALKNVWTDFPDSKEATQAKHLHAAAAYDRGDFDIAITRYTELKKGPNEGQMTNPSYRLGLAELQQGHLETARQHFTDMKNPQLNLSFDQYQQLPQKSPRLAATFSALLPGAGQLYTERPRQAAIAFTLNSAFIYGAIEAWDNENYAVSAILSLFELGWYGGNIYNAMNNAHKYNQQQQKNFIERLQSRFDLSLGWHYDHPAMTAQIRF
jgi:tetratricopeptide (TPR) repeat protein